MRCSKDMQKHDFNTIFAMKTKPVSQPPDEPYYNFDKPLICYAPPPRKTYWA